MKTLAVILARKGSAGLANKHLLPLLGRPVIDYTFDHARSARRLTRTVVSSDCPNIRMLATKRFLETIERPPELATADASVQDAVLHALHTLEVRAQFRADAIIILYGNVPVREEGLIDRAIDLLESTGCDSVRSMCPVGKWHPAWMWRMRGSTIEPNQLGSIHRRQELEPMFLHDGGVVAVRRDAMLLGERDPANPHAFFGRDFRGVLTGRGDTVEIDEERDLQLAEAILRSRQIARERMAS